jgi:hypothetical protein
LLELDKSAAVRAPAGCRLCTGRSGGQPYCRQCVKEAEEGVFGDRGFDEGWEGAVLIGVTHDLDRPGYGVINSDVVVIGGDSGSPWFTLACSGCGPTLIGITSSGDQATRGGVEGDSQAQPIWDVIEMVRSSKWGVQFKVWVE